MGRDSCWCRRCGRSRGRRSKCQGRKVWPCRRKRLGKDDARPFDPASGNPDLRQHRRSGLGSRKTVRRRAAAPVSIVTVFAPKSPRLVPTTTNRRQTLRRRDGLRPCRLRTFLSHMQVRAPTKVGWLTTSSRDGLNVVTDPSIDPRPRQGLRGRPLLEPVRPTAPDRSSRRAEEDVPSARGATRALPR
ncbi:hypothetical protein D9M68_302500 [compost metagenome]